MFSFWFGLTEEHFVILMTRPLLLPPPPPSLLLCSWCCFLFFFMFYSPCIYTNFPVMLFRIKIRITPVRPLHTKTGQTKRCGAHKTRDKAITDGCICKSIYTLFSIHFHSEKHFCFLSLNDTIKNTHTHKHNSSPCLNAWKVQKITANGNNMSQLGEQNQSRMSHSSNQRERIELSQEKNDKQT